MICEGVKDLSVEQVRDDTPNRFTSTTTYSREEVGDNFHGIHYRIDKGTRKGLYLCGGG
jgi:hypothetical protein